MAVWGVLNDSSPSESEAELEFYNMSSEMDHSYETGDRAAISVSRSRLSSYNGTKDVTLLEDFLYRVQNYADACSMKDPARIHLVTTLFEGNALSWYRLHGRGWESYSGYDEFVADLRNHFLPKNYQDKAEIELIRLRQTENVEDYIAKYSLLANRVGDRLSTRSYINIFVCGLNGRLRTHLLGYVDNFQTLTDATYMAARVSDSLKVGKYASTPQSSPYGFTAVSSSAGNSDYQRMDLDSVKVRKYPYGLDKVTYEFLRKNNGCFYCKELGHRANSCQLKKKADTPKKLMSLSEDIKEPLREFNVIKVKDTSRLDDRFDREATNITPEEVDRQVTQGLERARPIAPQGKAVREDSSYQQTQEHYQRDESTYELNTDALKGNISDTKPSWFSVTELFEMSAITAESFSVTVCINQANYRALIDTGAGANFMSTEIAKGLGLETIAPGKVKQQV